MRRYHRIFDIPVSMKLVEGLLRKDLRNLQQPWVRIGVNGEPSEDWPLTVRVCEICQEEGKRAVVIVRLWKLPTQEVLEKLKKASAILHVSLCALDAEPFRQARLEVLRKHRELGGKAVLRLVTFAFLEGDTRWGIQEELLRWGGLVLEQPARLQRSNPTWGLVDQRRYEPYHSYVSKQTSKRWFTAGQLYDVSACVTACPDCPNQCMTRR